MNGSARFDKLAHGAIDLGRDVVRVRVIDFFEDDWIREVMPEPEPPLVPKAGRGSLAPKVPDHDDPGYVRAFAKWSKRAAVLELAIAMDLEAQGQRFDRDWARAEDAGGDTARRWAEEAVRNLGEQLSRTALNEAIAQLRGIEGDLVRRAYCQVYGVDDEDLTIRERELLRIDIGAGANTLSMAMDLGKEYGQGDPIAWWEAMSGQNRAAVVARKVREVVQREEAGG